jgi:hypothetical protein
MKIKERSKLEQVHSINGDFRHAGPCIYEELRSVR